MKALYWTCIAVLLPLLGLASGCRSYHVDATVENRTGGAIQLLEVDYPHASFGVDVLASGGDYHYRFQIQGSGPVKVQYTESGTQMVRQMDGPTVHQDQEGQLEIVLLPNGTAKFHTQLNPDR